MAWFDTVLFNIDVRVTKAGLSFSPGSGIGIGESCLGMDNFHAASATTSSCLDDHRKTDLFGNFNRLINRFYIFFCAGKYRDPVLDYRLPGRYFVTHDPHTGRCRADKGNTTLLADFGKFGIF